MARGGPRAGSGRPKGAKSSREPKAPPDIRDAAQAVKMTPLEYMLSVMNDAGADAMRRDRMAMASAPYVHARPNPDGKKADAAADAKRAAADDSGDWGDDLVVPEAARAH